MLRGVLDIIVIIIVLLISLFLSQGRVETTTTSLLLWTVWLFVRSGRVCVCVWFNFMLFSFLCDFVLQNICFSRQSSSLSFHPNSTPNFFERASHAREIRKNELHCTQQRER